MEDQTRRVRSGTAPLPHRPPDFPWIRLQPGSIETKTVRLGGLLLVKVTATDHIVFLSHLPWLKIAVGGYVEVLFGFLRSFRLPLSSPLLPLGPRTLGTNDSTSVTSTDVDAGNCWSVSSFCSRIPRSGGVGCCMAVSSSCFPRVRPFRSISVQTVV
jgi:hypothetical protein